MSLSCRIIKGQVFAPNNNLSILYKSLEDKYGKDEALKRYALTETEDYKDSIPKTTDSNGEMTLESFNKFSLETTQQDFTQEVLDLQLRVGAKGIQTLKDSLFVQGVAIVNNQTLNSTGLFTQDESQHILENPEVQQNLINLLSNTESTNTEPIQDTYLTLSSNYNSIGLKPYLNPQTVKEEVLTVLSKANNASEVTELINNIEYPSIIDNYKNNQAFRNKIIEDALSHKEVEIQYDSDTVEKIILNTLDVEKLDQIGNQSQRVLNTQNRDIIDQEFLDLLDLLRESGLDVKNDTFSVVNMSTNSIQEIATNLFNFSQQPNQESVKSLNSLSQLFTINGTKIIDISNVDPKVNNLVYLDSTKTEIELFGQELVKHGKNIYQKIDDKYTTDELYEILYSKLLNNEITLSTPSIETEQQLQETANKPVIIHDIKNAVQKRTKDLGVGDNQILEKLAIYKTYYNAQEIKTQKQSTLPVENEEYLTSDFVSDFSKFVNYNKDNQTDIYNSLLRFFKITKKGLSLIDGSNYTQEHLKNIDLLDNRIKTDLINYSFLSKELDLGYTQLENPNLSKADVQRLEAVQYPETIPDYKGDFKNLTNSEIIIENISQPFINIKGKVYEKTMQLKENSVYSILPSQNSIYNNTKVERPLPELTAEDLESYLSNKEDVITATSNIIGSLELNEINKKYFKCN